MVAIDPNQEFIKSFEEVDLAFADRFSNIIINGKPVKVVYYTPDVDLLRSVAIKYFRFFCAQ